LRKPGKTATGQDAHTNAQEEGPNLRNFKYISGKEDEPWTKTIKESKRRCFNNICEEIDSNPWSFATRHKAAAVPSRRKTQRLVLIPKAEKPAEEPSSYRPLCILDTVGKILEKIIHSRLKGALVETHTASQRCSMVFRKGLSTIDAVGKPCEIADKAIKGKRMLYGTKQYCIAATLDVKNAFNSAS